MTDDELICELRRATDGVLMSETDYPFEIVELSGEGDPTPERLQQFMQSSADASVANAACQKTLRGTRRMSPTNQHQVGRREGCRETILI